MTLALPHPVCEYELETCMTQTTLSVLNGINTIYNYKAIFHMSLVYDLLILPSSGNLDLVT